MDWFLYDSNFRQERVNSGDDDDGDRDDDKFCFAMHTQPKTKGLILSSKPRRQGG